MNGVRSKSHAEKKRLVREDFVETFRCKEPDQEALKKVLQAVSDSGRVLTDEKAEEIESQVLKLDLTAVVEGLKMYKAPGADGIPNEFYYLLRENADLSYLLGGCSLP